MHSEPSGFLQDVSYDNMEGALLYHQIAASLAGICIRIILSVLLHSVSAFPVAGTLITPRVSLVDCQLKRRLPSIPWLYDEEAGRCPVPSLSRRGLLTRVFPLFRGQAAFRRRNRWHTHRFDCDKSCNRGLFRLDALIGRLS